MDRPEMKSTITLSGPNFYEKIIQKYQKGRKNIFKFTRIIFYKSTGNFFLDKINVAIQLRLHLNKQNIVPFSMKKSAPATNGMSSVRELQIHSGKKSVLPPLEKNIESISHFMLSITHNHYQRMLSWPNTGKNNLQLEGKQKNVQGVNNLALVCQRALKIQRSYLAVQGFFPAGYISKAVSKKRKTGKILNPLFLSVNTTFYPQAVHKIYSNFISANPQISNNRSQIHINIAWQSSFTKKESSLKHKTAVSVFPKRTSTNLRSRLYLNNLTQLYFYDKSILYSSILENTHIINGTIPWLNTKGNSLKSILRLRISQIINNEAKKFQTTLKIPRTYQLASGLFPDKHISTKGLSESSFLNFLVFKTGNTIAESNKILNRLFLAVNTASRQIIQSIYSDNSMVHFQILNYGKNMKIFNSQNFREKTICRLFNTVRHSILTNKENILQYQSVLEYKSPVVLTQDNLVSKSIMLDENRFFSKESAQVTANKPLIGNYYYSPGHGEFDSVQRNYTYKKGSEKLLFHDHKRIEQEIDQIKKIAIEAKESVPDKSKSVLGEADIKRYLDINRISSQVYQNIERKIRMERERRGM